MDTGGWTRAGALEVLEIVGVQTKAWTFLWPARVVIEPLTGGLVWLRGGERVEVPVGEALASTGYAAHLRVEASARTRFRVIFEDASRATAPCTGRVYTAERVRFDAAPSPSPASVSDTFARAVALLDPSSWRVPPFVSRARDHLLTRYAENIEL
jgi:hypothetical protein